MKIRVESIFEEGKSISAQIDPATIELDEPGRAIEGPLLFEGRAMRSAEEIYLEGKLKGMLRCECSRCLEIFTTPLDLAVNAVFVPQRGQEEDEDEIVESESNISYYDGESIDLLQEMKDTILVNLPIQSLCRPECKGLCPQCGADLNKGSCRCEQRRGPSPFEKLKELKPKL